LVKKRLESMSMGVSYVLTEEQALLRDQVTNLVAKEATPESLRRLITDAKPWDGDLWKSMTSLGLQGAAIPESCGGVGLGLTELSIVCEAIGRFVAPVPFFSSICLAAEAIKLAGSPTQRATWLPRLASGETIATLGWSEGATTPFSGALQTRVSQSRLVGRKRPVPDASLARLCVVVAADEEGEARLAVVDLEQSNVRRTPLDGFDQLRHHSAIEFDGATCEVLADAKGTEILRELISRAALINDA
jgi:alkylation response protein AidB-like acyl-CoA dehydrogenase